tara:strand:- start:64895 stop:65188 length:294 start_codon:yes stop_codon:yes gene_type:complete
MAKILMGVCSQYLWLAHKVTDLLVRKDPVVDLVAETAEAASVAEIAVETVVEVTEVVSVVEIAEATSLYECAQEKPGTLVPGFCVCVSEFFDEAVDS